MFPGSLAEPVSFDTLLFCNTDSNAPETAAKKNNFTFSYITLSFNTSPNKWGHHDL